MHHQLVELSIEISNECAMRCMHCSSGSSPQKDPNELTSHEHFHIMREAREMGATVLSLSGGDPIVVQQVWKYLDLAEMLQFKSILFYTTGIWHVDWDSVTNLNGNVPHICGMHNCGSQWSFLGSCAGLRMIFSLHSHIPSVNDYIMGLPGAWRAVTMSIARMKALGVPTEVHMVPMLPNYDHIPDMRDLCANLGVERLSLLRFVPQTRGKINVARLGLSIELFASLQRILHKEYTTRSEHPVELRAGCPIDFRHMIGLVNGKQNPCHAGTDLILVRPNGDVHPCAAWKSLPTDSNVREHSLAHIWEHSDVFNALRRLHKHEDRRIEPCDICENEDTCNGGCPAQRLHEYGPDLEEALYGPYADPLCVSNL